jgi:hypothetical protein
MLGESNMSRWLYQMSEAAWPFENYQAEVREGEGLTWPTRRIMHARDAPCAGDIMFCYYAPTSCDFPGIVGLGLVTRYRQKKSEIEWLPLFPTNLLKRAPWKDDRVDEIVEAIRRGSPRGTMYSVAAALEADLRRGVFEWLRHSK